MKNSMLLNEWFDSNGKKINHNKINSTPSVVSKSKGDFTSKYEKLIQHIEDVHGQVRVKKHTEHNLEIFFGKSSSTYYNYRLRIRFIPAEGCFEIKVGQCSSGLLIYAGEEDCWSAVLTVLAELAIITDRRLCEWKDKNGNKITSKSSSTAPSPATTNSTTLTIADQLKNMLYYHISHKPAWVIQYKINNLSDEGFYYEELCRGNAGTYTRDIVGVLDDKSNWVVATYQDGKLSHNWFGEGTGVKAMLNKLKEVGILVFPATGTTEHRAIFNESLSFAEDFKLYESLWN